MCQILSFVLEKERKHDPFLNFPLFYFLLHILKNVDFFSFLKSIFSEFEYSLSVLWTVLRGILCDFFPAFHTRTDGICCKRVLFLRFSVMIFICFPKSSSLEVLHWNGLVTITAVVNAMVWITVVGIILLVSSAWIFLFDPRTKETYCCYYVLQSLRSRICY